VISNESDNISEDIFEEESTPGETVIEENVPFVSNKSQCNNANEFKKQKKNTQSPFQTQLLNILEKSEKVDPDEALLMSFLNNVKKLTEDQKLDFQIHVIKFFKSLAPAQTTRITTFKFSKLYSYTKSTLS